MRILIAEDDSVSRRLLHAALAKWGYEIMVACDGNEAWKALHQPDPPSLLILDWLMPGMDGLEICRQARALPTVRSAYIILLTGRTTKEDIIQGLDAGADDYVTKPFDPGELRARVSVGVRVAQLQVSLADRVRELEDALAKVKTLSGMLPICACCKKIRDDKGYWSQIETYISQHSSASFTHGLCPDCAVKTLKEAGIEASTSSFQSAQPPDQA
jgi:DNA-binding response OmpR family regulator